MNTKDIKKLANEAYSYILNECDVNEEHVQVLASYILTIKEKASKE